MARRATSRKNLFGFFEKKTSTTYRSGGVTKRELEQQAFKAGQRSGDSGQFKEWARSKHLAEKWGAVRDFEGAYRKGVERGEVIEEKKEAKKAAVQAKQEQKREQKLVVAKTVEEVTEALIAQGLAKGKAQQLARSKYAKGDSFDDLWRKVLAKVPKDNPARHNPQAGAEKMYEEFTGLPATEVLEFKETEHYHKFTAVTGKLVCLDILTVDGKELPLIAPGFKFTPAKFLRRDIRHSSAAESADASWIQDPSISKDKIVYVTFTEDGKQMIFRGGDQRVPYKALGLNGRDERDNMFIGTIVQITYRGKKSFEMDGKEEVDFHHPFGGQGSGGILPILGYLSRTERMVTFGGRYKIAPVRSDIQASPGIVG